MGTCIVVDEATVVPLQFCGEYYRMAQPGWHCAMWGVGRGPKISMALKQSTLKVRTRTKDNVFISIFLDVQWGVASDPAEIKVLQSGTKTPSYQNYAPTQRRNSSPPSVPHPSGASYGTFGGKGKKGAGVGGGRDGASVALEVSSSSSSQSEDLNYFDQHADNSAIFKKTRDELLYQAAYSTYDPEQQILCVIEEYFRITVNKHKMDDLFDLGSSITIDCCKVANRTINEYGYGVKKVVVKDIQPDDRIRNAMNNIVACEKELAAIVTRAEADKTTKIKAAEAQAEVARLQGEGVAKQRLAICQGLRDTVDDFVSATGTDAPSVMSLLMMTQHTDMVKECLSYAKDVTMVLKATPVSAVILEEEIRNSLTSDGSFARPPTTTTTTTHLPPLPAQLLSSLPASGGMDTETVTADKL